MRNSSSSAFREICREVRARFPSAFGGEGRSSVDRSASDLRSWLSTAPDRKGVGQLVARPGVPSGSLEALLGLVEETRRRRMRMVWIDPADCLDPSSAFPEAPRHLLWARGGGLETALRVADTVLRDENFPFVCLDGALVPAVEWKRVPLDRWYRLQRIVHRRGTALLLCTPPLEIPPARWRLVPAPAWSFPSVFSLRPEELRAGVALTPEPAVAAAGETGARAAG